MGTKDSARAQKQQKKKQQKKNREIVSFYFCSAARNCGQNNLTANEKYTEINHVYSAILLHTIFLNLDVTCIHATGEFNI